MRMPKALLPSSRKSQDLQTEAQKHAVKIVVAYYPMCPVSQLCRYGYAR